jgi:hypothetical protein
MYLFILSLKPVKKNYLVVDVATFCSRSSTTGTSTLASAILAVGVICFVAVSALVSVFVVASLLVDDDDDDDCVDDEDDEEVDGDSHSVGGAHTGHAGHAGHCGDALLI